MMAILHSKCRRFVLLYYSSLETYSKETKSGSQRMVHKLRVPPDPYSGAVGTEKRDATTGKKAGLTLCASGSGKLINAHSVRPAFFPVVASLFSVPTAPL